MRPWTSAFVGLLMLGGVSPASAGPIPSIGNDGGPTIYFIQGQSFTPSIMGDRGHGTLTPSPAGTVRLMQFQFDFARDDPNGTPPPVLYIYGFEPSRAQVFYDGEGSLGTGTHIGGGVYAFNNLEIPFSRKSYAVLPDQRSIFDGPGDPYGGGVDLFPQGRGIWEGNGNFDASFTAVFAPAAVPEPTTLMLVGTGILGLIGRRWVRGNRPGGGG